MYHNIRVEIVAQRNDLCRHSALSTGTKGLRLLSTQQVILPTGRTKKLENPAVLVVEIHYLLNTTEHDIVNRHKTLGGVLDLVFDYNKGQEKEVNGSCLVKHYGCLAPGAVSALSQRRGN